jgi:hypothetical protein
MAEPRERSASWATQAAAALLGHAGHVFPLLKVTQAMVNYGHAAAQIASAALTGKSSMSKMDVPSFCFMAGSPLGNLQKPVFDAL